jgi:hypothetical protein
MGSGSNDHLPPEICVCPQACIFIEVTTNSFGNLRLATKSYGIARRPSGRRFDGKQHYIFFVSKRSCVISRVQTFLLFCWALCRRSRSSKYVLGDNQQNAPCLHIRQPAREQRLCLINRGKATDLSRKTVQICGSSKSCCRLSQRVGMRVKRTRSTASFLLRPPSLSLPAL